MTINVTQTQKLVAEAALAAVGADHLAEDPAAINDLIRAMLVIEKGRMQAYMLRGFNWSYRARYWQDPEKVRLERSELDETVEWFHGHINAARGEAARRIRGNRARHIREMDRIIDEQVRENEERREKRRLQRELKLAAQPIEQLIA